MPDMAPLANPGLIRATNVRPGGGGYLPVRALSPVSAAIPARVIGYASYNRTNGIPVSFAGTASNLYWLNSTAWTDVLTGSVSVTSGNQWEFAQYGVVVLAMAKGVAPRSWDLTADPSVTTWSTISGPPSTYSHMAVLREFVVFGNDSTYPQRIRWGANGSYSDWAIDPLGTEADEQDLPDGGDVMRIVGGQYGVIVQRHAIRRMTYVGGAIIWQIDRIENGKGTVASGSVVNYGPLVFYLDEDGFWLFDGNASRPIGTNRVNRTFWADANLAEFSKMSSAIDPQNTLVYWAYVSRTNSTPDPTPDKIICYNYTEDKWSLIETGENVDYIATGLTESVTLDGLDALFAEFGDVSPAPDDPFWDGNNLDIAIIDSSHRLAYLKGNNLAATIETGEMQMTPGSRSRIRRIVPMCDGGSVSISVGYRDIQSTASPTYTTATAQSATGYVSPRGSTARYQRFRITTSAGTDFDRLLGLDIDYDRAGTI